MACERGAGRGDVDDAVLSRSSAAPSSPPGRPSLLLAAALVALLVACGGGGGGGDDTTESADELSPVPDPLESLGEPPPGQGVAVIGIEELSFTVTTCTEGPRPEDTSEATLDYLVEGTGESSDGPFTIELSRYRSDSGVGDPVFTETARIIFGVADDVRGAEAKRTSAGADGGWLDLADPESTTPLIERRGDSYDVRATFGPEGARASDDGLEAGRLRARCPA